MNIYNFDHSHTSLTIGSQNMTISDIYSCVNFVRELRLNLETDSDISFLSDARDFEDNASSWIDCRVEWALGLSLATLICKDGVWRFSCELHDDVALSAIKLMNR